MQTTFEISEDENESVQIGNIGFNIVESQSTVKLYFDMHVTILLKTEQVERGKEQKLLSDKPNLMNGEIKIHISLKNICDKGTPTGVFDFKNGSTGAPHHLSFYIKGINHLLGFSGQVTVKNGWIGIDGVIKERKQDFPNWSINMVKKIQSEQLAWTQYSYTLEEAAGMPPELVTSVYLEDFDGAVFPEQILQYKSLTHLRLHNSKANTKTITKLPDAIGDLPELTSLTINNTAIEYLPESIFKLPKLQQLNLSNCRLRAIPSDIDLPKLSNASLTNNQLTTLPTSLAKQPSLVSLQLDQNPWRSLPQAFADLKLLKLDINEKRRLFSYGYRGAESNAAATRDNKVFFAKADVE